jgi:hypothetical protein
MTTRTILGRQGALGILSIVLALLGLLLFWLQPIGLVFSGAGILAGILGVGASYSAGGRPYRQAGAGLILSFGALLINLSLTVMLRTEADPRVLEPTPQRLPATTP